MNSIWFEISIVLALFAFGNIFFGHFESHTPKWRRVAKIIVLTTGLAGVSWFFGRFAFFVILFLILCAVLYVHTIWLPKNGINGWTGEPRDRYLELRSVKSKQRS